MTVPEPWLIHFFQRHQDDDPARPTPTIEFLDGLPDKIAAQIQAVLEAVAAAPPPSFSGGVCLGGLTKPVRSAANPRDYSRVRQYADEFRKRRTVHGQPGSAR